MDNRWSHLSNELLHHILLYVYSFEQDIYECTHVCKSWKYVAQSICYSHLTIHNTSHFRKIENIMMAKEGSPAKYVKSLHYNIRLHRYYLPNISNMFPFLEHLSTPEPNSTFYENLIALRKESKFSRLKSFSANSSSLCIDSYIKCALGFRSTLTTLAFNVTLWSDKNSYYQFKTHLKDFPCLTELYIEHSIGYCLREARTINEFDSVIDECKHLKKIGFSTVYDAENKQPVDMQIVKPRPDIEKLNIKMTTLRNDDILAYVQHKFPKLKELVLDNKLDTVIKSSHSSCWLDNLPKVLTYITQIPSYHVQYRVNLLETDIFNIIHHCWELPTTRNTPKNIEMCYALPEDGVLNNLDFKQTQSCFLHTRVSFSQRDGYSYLYSFLEELIGRHGESIQGITLRFSCNINDLKVYASTQLFFTHCLNVKSIQFENLYVTCPSFQVFSGLGPFSLDNLHFINCKLDPNLLCALSPAIQYINRARFDGCRHKTNSAAFEMSEDLYVHLEYTSINLLEIANTLGNSKLSVDDGKIFCELKTINPECVEYFSIDSFYKKLKPRYITKELYLKAYQSYAQKPALFYSIHCKAIKKLLLHGHCIK